VNQLTKRDDVRSKIAFYDIFFVSILLLPIYDSGYSQSRQNSEPLVFTSRSEKLAAATGWKVNSVTGKWINNENVIDDKECPRYWISHIPQNFRWIQISTVNKDSSNYYVFHYERLAGEYEYPNIRENWEMFLRTQFFILDSIQFSIREFKY
jgi:hypothetical protein